MNKAIGWVLASALLFCSDASTAASPPGQSTLARELLESCLRTPTSDAVSQLAASVGAQAYSEVRRQHELKTNTSLYPEPANDQDQRTRTTVTAFLGWDLPGPGAGSLEYRESKTQTDWVDRATGQQVTPVSVSLGRACQVKAPVANARAIFELYEGLTKLDYGIRISADRRWVDVFMFDPDQYDIELSFALDRPLGGLPASKTENRLVMSDGGSRFLNEVAPGIATVNLTRAALLGGLDQTATINLINQTIEPVVQRLAGSR